MTEEHDPAVGSDAEAALVITSAAEATADWLTAVLQLTGHDVTATAVTTSPVGTGQMGESHRLTVTVEGPDAAAVPASFVLKLPMADDEGRAMVAPGYRSEVVFYRHIAPTITARIPGCHFAAGTDGCARFALLLEDLAPADQGDQSVPATLEQVTLAARNLAGLHAPRWSDPTLWDVPHVTRDDEATAGFWADVFAGGVERYLDRLGDRLTAAETETVQEVAGGIVRLVLGHPDRFAIVHGDYRLDNLLFHPDGTEVAAVDWQSFVVANPGRDVGYLIATSFDADVRADHEVGVVTDYHRCLLEAGVTGYDLEACLDDYRVGILQGPMISILGAAYAAPTERGDDVLTMMLKRSLRAVVELGSLAP